jgi:type III secretion protein T
MLVKEAALGAVIGLMVGLPLRIPELVGDIIDNQRGAAVTDSFNPSSGENVSMLGQLLSLSIVVYFFTEQGFERLIRVVIATFKLTPVDSFTVKFQGTDVWETLFGLFIDYLTLFAILALPVMIAMFMAEIALAMASRFASSLNVFSLAQPVKALLATSIIITIFPKILDSILKLTDQTIRFFGG